jgi:anhydro-N-acetylmuramic acid kinase
MIALGAMSGTSTDGIDVAAIQIDSDSPSNLQYLGVISTDFPKNLRNNLLDLQRIPPTFPQNSDPISLLLQARRDLTRLYIKSCKELLTLLRLDSSSVNVLGAHGQTLRHRPDLGYTCQILDGALLATELGIDVVCDFRSKDVALGGQGAPLVPAFHQAWLNGKQIYAHAAVLNLGGFSNLTLLNGLGNPPTGGDCGPANCLMDLWAQRAFGQTMDKNGDIASTGKSIRILLDEFWKHPFFKQGWPKSTGRDDFNEQWFNGCLATLEIKPSPEDIMTTLLDLTVKAIKFSLPPLLSQVFVCGGGAKNSLLIKQLRNACPSIDFLPIEILGLPTQAVEASAFAWLAVQRLVGDISNCPSVTGARREGILGALHLAN